MYCAKSNNFGQYLYKCTCNCNCKTLYTTVMEIEYFQYQNSGNIAIGSIN